MKWETRFDGRQAWNEHLRQCPGTCYVRGGSGFHRRRNRSFWRTPTYTLLMSTINLHTRRMVGEWTRSRRNLATTLFRPFPNYPDFLSEFKTSIPIATDEGFKRESEIHRIPRFVEKIWNRNYSNFFRENYKIKYKIPERITRIIIKSYFYGNRNVRYNELNFYSRQKREIEKNIIHSILYYLTLETLIISRDKK